MQSALLQGAITPFSRGGTSVFRETCGELDAVLPYEVETAVGATV